MKFCVACRGIATSSIDNYSLTAWFTTALSATFASRAETDIAFPQSLAGAHRR